MPTANGENLLQFKSPLPLIYHSKLAEDRFSSLQWTTPPSADVVTCRITKIHSFLVVIPPIIAAFLRTHHHCRPGTMTSMDEPQNLSALTRDHALSLLKTSKYSDFAITCEDLDFKVHRCIITVSSAYFRAAIDGGFSESTSNRLILQDTTTHAVAVTVVWLYAKPVSAMEALRLIGDMYGLSAGTTREQFIIFLDTYLLADRLMLTQLKEELCLSVGGLVETARDAVEDDVDLLPVLLFFVKTIYKTIPDTDDLLRPKLTSFLVADECMPHNLPEHIAAVNERPAITGTRDKPIDLTGNGSRTITHGDEFVDLTRVLALVEAYDAAELQVGKNLLRMFRCGGIGVYPQDPSFTPDNYWR